MSLSALGGGGGGGGCMFVCVFVVIIVVVLSNCTFTWRAVRESEYEEVVDVAILVCLTWRQLVS